MAYVSLYRKYRPQTFDQVVGQAHVTRTLSNAVAEGRSHHAYLFTGPRGTGKTSTARILAKALNCEQGPTPDPCNACAQCEAITSGASVDVIEIDAASHGGVDDVRDLRDRVAFAPASARTKVYIVDECHMLSTAGWNAFLKTVEEPPGHVVFVFATTEPHKVLATILSRTQRFDFKRVAADVLDAHTRAIGDREDLDFEPGAVDLIVRAGDGSVRDTLSVLDQVVAFTGRHITLEGVADVLGAVPGQLLTETADLIAAGDVAGVCRLVQRLADGGQDLRQFARDAIEHLRALFLVQVAPEAGLVDATPERLAQYKAQAGRLGRVELLRAIELLGDSQAAMRRGNTRLPLEIALVKAAAPDASGDPAALAARIDRLERRTGAAPAGSAADPPRDAADPPRDAADPPRDAADPPRDAADPPRDPAADPAGEAPPDPPRAEADPTAASPGAEPAAPANRGAAAPTEATEPTGPVPGEPAAAAPVDLDLVQRSWPAVLEATKQRKRTLHAFLTEARPAALGDGVLVLEFRPGYDFHAEHCGRDEAVELLSTVFEEVFGAPLRIRCTVGDGEQPQRTETDEKAAAFADQAAAIAETEAAAQAGELPDDAEAHTLAVRTLKQRLGATVIDEE